MADSITTGFFEIYKTVFAMTCSELKMNPFISILLGQEPMPVWWEDVYSEYMGLRENKSSSFILSLVKEITYLETKVFIITKCIEVLSVTYSRELVMEVKQCGCSGKFDWSNKAAYSNDCKAALSFSKKYVGQVLRKKAELEEYQKRHGGGTIQRKDFDIWAVTLGKFMGFRVDFDAITVAEYCHMMNQYEKYCEVSHATQNNLIDGRR